MAPIVAYLVEFKAKRASSTVFYSDPVRAHFRPNLAINTPYNRIFGVMFWRFGPRGSLLGDSFGGIM